jgi:[ribosomal protein S18]-alanine N-acetyltransferase
MKHFFRNWLSRPLPAFSPAGSQDAAYFAQLHQASFARGWTESEFERLLLDRNVLAHRCARGGRPQGFVLSRIAADEAEILSIAVAAAQQGRGMAGALLDFHLRALAGRGVRAVFLEVDDANVPARKLYARRQFREVGRRRSYYREQGGTALVLRRGLT